MLTLILLVVLGGGVGILAVSMAERKPAMHGDGSRRAQASTAGPETPVAAEPASSPEPEPTPPRPSPRRSPRPTGSSLSRQSRRGPVPASQTALEGPLGVLLRPTLPRRAASLVGIVVITVVVGVGIAAVLGAVVGGAAEIVGNTIG